MASVDDVMDALCELIAQFAYPNGTDADSIAGVNITVHPGWPVPADLDEAMQQNRVVVSVFPRNIERNTTREVGKRWRETTRSVDGLTGDSVVETKRQEKDFQITIWAPDPFKRKTVAKVIDARLSNLLRIDLNDGTKGMLNYSGSEDSDALQNKEAYTRHLFYSVEYATTITETDFVVQGTNINITPM